jgi:hypothetical protein
MTKSTPPLEEEIDKLAREDFPGEEINKELRECYRQYLLIRRANDPIAEAVRLSHGWGPEVFENCMDIAAGAQRPTTIVTPLRIKPPPNPARTTALRIILLGKARRRRWRRDRRQI